MSVQNQFGPATWRALCFKVVGHASNACLDFVYDQSVSQLALKSADVKINKLGI